MTSAEFKSWHRGFLQTLNLREDFECGIFPIGDMGYIAVVEKVAEMVEKLNEVPTPYPVFLQDLWPFPQEKWTDQQWGGVVSEQHHAEATADAHRFYHQHQAFVALGAADATVLLASVRK